MRNLKRGAGALLALILLLGLVLSGIAQEAAPGDAEESSAAFAAAEEHAEEKQEEKKESESKEEKKEGKEDEKQAEKENGKPQDKAGEKDTEKQGENTQAPAEESGMTAEEKKESEETAGEQKESDPDEALPDETEASEDVLKAAEGEDNGETGQEPASGSGGGDPAPKDGGDDPDSLKLTVTVAWEDGGPDPEIAEGYLEVALFSTKTKSYPEILAGYGYGSDMENYWPLDVSECRITTVRVTPGESWTKDVTISRSQCPDIGEGETLAEYAEHLVWKEELLLNGYVWKSQVTSEDGRTTIYNGYPTDRFSQAVRIEWLDNDDVEKLRPQSVEAKLNYDGKSITLDADGNWTGMIDDLPVYVDGTKFDYDWSTSVSKYTPAEIRYNEQYEEGEFEEGTILTVIALKCLVTTEYEEVEVPQAHYKLTVRYYAGKEKLFDNYVGIYAAGESYNVKSPVKAGYSADKPRVKGTITENTKITVKYTPQEYTLTVRFRGTDGTDLAPAYTGKAATGSGYQVTAPEVNGYTPQTRTVSGTMPGRDNEIVVYYTKVSSQPEEVELHDYETPLGLGMVSVNAGDCLE